MHLYSLRNQAYVYSLKFNSRVLGLRCSPRLLVVALDAQLHAFDATSLSHVFSAVTYPAPCTHQLYQSETCAQGTAVPLALGSRWLAFASNQVAPQVLSMHDMPSCAALGATYVSITSSLSSLHLELVYMRRLPAVLSPVQIDTTGMITCT